VRRSLTTTHFAVRYCLMSRMVATTRTAASHTKSIHLLRALLREATYLPDAVARQYFHGYIVNRFRAYQPRQDATTSIVYRHRNVQRRALSIITERTDKVQKKAQKGLHYLRRANQGEIPCLKKVLHFAYGRMGKRKYALLGHVLKPDPIMDGGKVLAASEIGGPTPLQELYYSDKQWLQYFDAPKPGTNGMQVINISDRYSRLRAVIKSQYQRGVSINRELKGPAMKTPVHNIWMRPMPIKRARNNVRRWYAETMTRLLPPLPAEEWDKIKAMIEGSEKMSLVRHRTPATSSSSVTAAEHSLQTISGGLALSKRSKADRPNGMWRPHHIKVKFMRRMYSRLLQLCPKVEWNSERNHWTTVWGPPIQKIKPSIYQAETNDILFAGVDLKGKIPPAPKKHKEPKPAPDGTKLQPRNDKGEYVRFPFFTEYLPENNPLRKDLDTWKKKRVAAGIVDEDGTFRGR
jgi:hypothetical protein